jgi:hypothetical protein
MKRPQRCFGPARGQNAPPDREKQEQVRPPRPTNGSGGTQTLTDRSRARSDGRLKVRVYCADGLEVIIGPKYVAWAQDTEPSERTLDSIVELHQWSDDQLYAHRDRRMEAGWRNCPN